MPRIIGQGNASELLFTGRAMKADEGERFHFKVFGGDGKPCERCGTAIVRSEAAGRRLYACPRCQS